MMKSKILMLTTLVVLLFVSSCKKDDNETPFAKIQSATYYNGNGAISQVSTYVYDDQGRIVRESQSNGYYTTYEYTSTSVTVSSYTDNIVLTNKEVYTLNSNGLATALTSTDYETSGSTTTSTVTKTVYTYDDANFLIKSVETASDLESTWVSTNTATVSASNVASTTKTRSVTPTGSTTSTYTATSATASKFLTDKTNTIGFANIGLTFLGAQSANLEASNTFTSSTTTGGTTVTETPSATKFVYEYDDNGFVTKMTTVTTVGTGATAISYSSIVSYTYR